jgi:hypothetical protein
LVPRAGGTGGLDHSGQQSVTRQNLWENIFGGDAVENVSHRTFNPSLQGYGDSVLSETLSLVLKLRLF